MTPRAVMAQLVTDMGLVAGTHPENVAAYRLAQAGHSDLAQQFAVGRYKLDFAWPKLLVALEVDGPHHHRPDVAHKDALRDARLRELGWVILRINTGEDFERQIANASALIHCLKQAKFRPLKG